MNPLACVLCRSAGMVVVMTLFPLIQVAFGQTFTGVFQRDYIIKGAVLQGVFVLALNLLYPQAIIGILYPLNQFSRRKSCRITGGRHE